MGARRAVRGWVGAGRLVVQCALDDRTRSQRGGEPGSSGWWSREEEDEQLPLGPRPALTLCAGLLRAKLGILSPRRRPRPSRPRPSPRHGRFLLLLLVALALHAARRRRLAPPRVPRRPRRLPVCARDPPRPPQARASPPSSPLSLSLSLCSHWTSLTRGCTQGYLDLARAKLALGPGRVSPRSYDLSDSAAQLGVCALSLSLLRSRSPLALAVRAQGQGTDARSVAGHSSRRRSTRAARRSAGQTR